MKAQSTIEFTFAMVATMFLVFSMIMVFRWAGLDLANRRVTQDKLLTAPVVNGDPSSQLNSEENTLLPLSAVYHGSITGNISK